ncbi:MAG: HlyD family efflux transporter periplasmic adaptor subunit [Bacteroidota bacterium]
MKKVLRIVLGIAIVLVGVVLFTVMARQRPPIATTEETEIPLVSTSLVSPSNLPYVIEVTGMLSAKRKIEVYSEVQGLLQYANIPFKVGNSFGKGQALLRINSNEYGAQVQSNKSELVNRIAAMLPDMEMEFPEAAKNWEAYLDDFDMQKPLAALPEPLSNAEKLFVTGRNIYQQYYSVKNQMERLGKYTIRAPFTGVLTEANANAGTLIRSGQKLGEFIDPSHYEIALAIPAQANSFVAAGKTVMLQTLDGIYTYEGRVARTNAKIDNATQTISVIAEVSHPDLKAGQYLKVSIAGAPLEQVVQIPSNLIVENNMVYVVQDSTLALKEIIPVNYVGDSVMVRGFEPQTVLVNQLRANAYPGQKVTY